ncbi:hypothetical protein, partial [Escherichia coli]
QKKLIMLPSETMIWQPEFTDKTLSRKPGAVQYIFFADSGRRSRTITDKMIIHHIEYKGFYGVSRNWLDEVWRKMAEHHV